MGNDKTDHIHEYIQPVVNSDTPLKLIEGMYFTIALGETGEEVVDVVEVEDIYNIVLATQIESSILILEKLIDDDNVVMSTDLEKAFRKYISELREVLNRTLKQDFNEKETE